MTVKMQAVMILALTMIVASVLTLFALTGIVGHVSGGDVADIQLLTVMSLAFLICGTAFFLVAYELTEVRAMLKETILEVAKKND